MLSNLTQFPPRSPPSLSLSLRGKPIGGAFIALGIIVLLFGKFQRAFENLAKAIPTTSTETSPFFCSSKSCSPGTFRFYKVQNTLIRGYFPPSRIESKSDHSLRAFPFLTAFLCFFPFFDLTGWPVSLVALISGGLIIAAISVILGTHIASKWIQRRTILFRPFCVAGNELNVEWESQGWGFDGSRLLMEGFYINIQTSFDWEE